MKHLIICSVLLYIFIVLITNCHGAPRGPKRSKTSSIALIPTLRVGRSGPLTWDIDPEMYEAVKRKLLTPIIRSGRGGDSVWMREDGYSLQKRNENNNVNTGMWFGPRLGRVQKRNVSFQDAPWSYVIFGENPSSRQVDYTPRLGRESDEVVDENAEQQGIQDHTD